MDIKSKIKIFPTKYVALNKEDLNYKLDEIQDNAIYLIDYGFYEAKVIMR